MQLIFIITILIVLNIGIIIGVMMTANRGDINYYNERRKTEKELKKNKIVKYVKKHGSIRSSEVEEMLNISPKTATNYLQELSKENRIKQEGKRGRSVHYVNT